MLTTKLFLAFSLLGIANALMVLSPSSGNTWVVGKPQTVAWSSVDTDPTSVRIFLSNMASYPNVNIEVTTVEVEAGSAVISTKDFPTGSGFQINLVSTSDLSIYAQSGQFNLVADSSSSSTSGASSTSATSTSGVVAVASTTSETSSNTDDSSSASSTSTLALIATGSITESSASASSTAANVNGGRGDLASGSSASSATLSMATVTTSGSATASASGNDTTATTSLTNGVASAPARSMLSIFVGAALASGLLFFL
ncbi:hypothetical protein SJAG_01861 [Schizosaccharomyces japonicus yFS275]|uniref:Yeast cell wall synthesis Kre9/Knh1-like N-terminal domain-containing protein n=1 Tax=Schizosaccharomyces japonicus (strain yFS275 / FY16936) TaxID=402676 RepID=B6JZ37_SCHJY|nr:hypothetical protein SJAG_01861 [Schizosaccharomyces japonicus yFS275]EEB06805.1 hypothetical protein SJAG_01861 [Schizosaccharomyces japonicus yFS275]